MALKPAAPPAPEKSTEALPPQPPDACTYVRNEDGSLTRLDAPTLIPEFAPKE